MGHPFEHRTRDRVWRPCSITTGGPGRAIFHSGSSGRLCLRRVKCVLSRRFFSPSPFGLLMRVDAAGSFVHLHSHGPSERLRGAWDRRGKGRREDSPNKEYSSAPPRWRSLQQASADGHLPRSTCGARVLLDHHGLRVQACFQFGCLPGLALLAVWWFLLGNIIAATLAFRPS